MPQNRAEVQRQTKKTKSVKILADNISRLRARVRRDMDSDDERDVLTALAVAIMDKTGERVGNDESAKKGHYGVTGLRVQHVKVKGDKVTLAYVGKSGVEHKKDFTDSGIALILKKLLKRRPHARQYVFVAEDGYKLKSDRVNRYLKDLGVTAKDIRGYSANRFMLEALRKAKMPDNERERKSKFLSLLKSVAERVGHTQATLRKDYLLPSVEDEYVRSGKVVDIKTASRESRIAALVCRHVITCLLQ